VIHRRHRPLGLIAALLLLSCNAHIARGMTHAPDAATANNAENTPPNPLRDELVLKLAVSTPGLQMLSGAELMAAGVPTGTRLADLALTLDGADVLWQAIELPDDEAGVLDGGDRMRFVASDAGDLWSTATTYWLTVTPSTDENARAPASSAELPFDGADGAQIAHQPIVQPRAHIDLTRRLNAEAIYIAPAAFHDALAPLIALRNAQGVSTALVDVQAIFDTWSYGQVSPQAIRSFLRYARQNWFIAPRAVILVGDGTFDRQNSARNRGASVIPPYVADVDLWLHETACDWCYAQLDGDDPRSDGRIELMYGRLPARTEMDVAAIVGKIVSYETAQPEAWRFSSAFIADNFRQLDGSVDGAGNFAYLLDEAQQLQPRGWSSTRVYYDPTAASDSSEPWRVADADAARARTHAAFANGAGFITYAGHGLTDQWADTAPGATGATWLLKSRDIASLSNRERLPIVLEMACSTGSFHDANATAGSIDEQLLLARNGGAVAVVGFAGLSVSYVHEHLMRGIFNRLSAGNGQDVLLGELVVAGQDELVNRAGEYYKVGRSLVLLGDPMMRVRTPSFSHSVFAPIVSAQ
jgi:Peptidase family C25